MHQEATMPKLTDSQLVILSGAAARDDRALLPFPKSLKLNKGALTAVINSLIKNGLAREEPAERDQMPWRQADGQKVTLVITDAGLKAAGFDVDEQPGAPPAVREPAPKKVKSAHSPKVKTATSSKQPATEPSTKQALLIDLLKRKTGATIAEVIKATGWQAHSVRGAISGTLKKKLGLTVELKLVEGRGRVYQIAGGR
jgi:hypothetical protein